MRWTRLIALTVFLPAVSALAQNDVNPGPPKLVKTPTSLPRPKAEPENGQAYGPVHAPEEEPPSPADVGPAQKHFVRASTLDHLEETQNADNASLLLKEKIALDKRITVPKIHDVLDDGGRGGADDNHALAYELTYLNWGAVTKEQLKARQGHYFTITWDNDGPKADFTARFEYREVKSKEIVRTLTQPMPGVSGTTRSYFAVVDQAYQAYGPVISWRFSVLRGDTVVAEVKSFIW